mmetsp:Transcript_9203/g.21948  ORF Transcript_9203/g.21948 Transcript_9203/m.21948 type:complete len:283 (+) Transcript_9203:44-892(+)
MVSLVLIAATLLLLAENVTAGERKCFANGDCLEIVLSMPSAWTPPCSWVSEEGTGEIQIRLDHPTEVIHEYCVIPTVDWGEGAGATTLTYKKECGVRTNRYNIIKVPYQYTQEGTYTTQATIKIPTMNIFWPPNQLEFTSEKVAITLGSEYCIQLDTVPPTQTPTMIMPTPNPTPPPTAAPVTTVPTEAVPTATPVYSPPTEPPVGPIWNVAPVAPPPETFAPTKAPTTPSPTISPTTTEQGAGSRTVPADRSGSNDDRRWVGTILLGQLFVTVCYFFHYWL